MPNQRLLTSLTQASAQGHLTFKEHKLNLYVVKKDMSMMPLGFYKSVMKQTPHTGTDDDGSSIIYIQNIPQSDAATLRNALTKIGCVRNVLPLLNKAFVEFETDNDADRLGVWHSLMREGSVYTVTRLSVPRSTRTSQQPQQPLRALPDRKEILSAAGAPDAQCDVPQGTAAPCWVTMKTAPYVFPTACPWFNVPKFVTVQREEHILTTPHLGSEFSTVMLTGLPEATYKHEDVARLVCRYFPKQDLQSLYYNVVVLPLQRRAFVFFCDWEACRSFVSDCVKKPISVMNCTLSVHLVLEDMHPGASEETMYRALMKWSNGYVPEFFLLGKHLLCVEMFETNVELIKNVMKKVAAISSFVTFLPLANRIWIEMVSHSSATKVLQEMSSRRDSSTYIWSKVGRIECATDLHQRLKETGQITINLGAKTPGVVGAEPPSLKTEAHVPLSEARDDAADASSAAPAIVTESRITESESKLGDGVAESANEVQDPKVKAATITEESQPCRTTSTVEGNAVSCATGQEKKTQKDPVPNSVSSVSAAPIEALPSAKVQATTKEVVRKQPALSDYCLTPGEQMETLLFIYKIRCHGHGIIMSPESLESRLLLLFNLPKDQDGSYTEDDISNLLQKFGYQHEDKNIYVIPQACMAFAVMPSYQEAREVFIAAKQDLTLNGSRLFVRIVKSRGDMTPFKFYKCLMETVDFEVADDGSSVVYIHNISPSEARDLRETLNKVESVKNYLPLLNKVFIEFESALDADRIGVWYSLLKRCPPHYIWRTNLPITTDTALPPRLAAKALPDAKDIVAGPVVPVKQLGVPQGSKAPFFINLTNEPFLFPTVSPWFIVPRFCTVLTEEDLVESASVASKFSTVMLTGLPEGNYKHEEVAQLVWKYFPKQNLWVSFYNIVVLPLQKRAFVYFNDWQSCREFAEDYLKNQVSLKGHVLNVHLILEEMHPKFREKQTPKMELMYQTLMKWSNAHVPELESLQDRLLCVELLETSLPLIIAILTSVTSVSPIVSFLPLANRVCIEMADPRGVTWVVAKHAQKPEDWSHFGRVESAKSLKQRLQDSCKTKIDLEMHTKDINAKTPAVKSEPPPQVGTVNVEVTEVKGESSAERLTPATTVKTEPSKPSAKPQQSPQTNLKTQETSEKGPSQDQECTKPKTNISENSGLVKTKNNPPSKISTASAEVGPNGKSPETGRTCTAASSAEASSLTTAKKLFWHLKHLNPRHEDYLPMNWVLSSYILNVNITLGVTNLPKFGDGGYTQTDIMNLLQNLGLKCQYHQFFFVPEVRKAFLVQANVREVQTFFKNRNFRNVFLKESRLFFHVFQNYNPLTSFGFYRFLMSFSDFLKTWEHFDETNVVYLHSVSEHKVQELKKAISKNDSVINYLPLHDKVFIHCKTPLDAERVKAWYSFWKHRLSHNIQQMATSDTFNTSKRPGLAAPALPLGQKVTHGPNVPITTDANPEGSRATFWITMTRSPYMFHIAAPWFNIPAHQTISHITHLELHLKFPTIMLTGLPNSTNYTHEDVVLLVWKYFPEQTLHTLYNNVVVLPLQRRAFVFFSSSDACLRFLQDKKKIKMKLKDSLPKIHLVLEDIQLGSSEVSMFRTLMKWSNIHVPEQDSLEERLLCVEVSGTNDKNVMMVMKEVAMIATFTSFLPLANRIYIEMVDSSGASKVMENLSVSRLADQRDAWKQVGRVESLVSRKERLKDARKIAVNLERGTVSVYREATQLKGPLCSRKEEELATLKALPDKSLLPSDKGTENLPIDLDSLNKLKAIILQRKNERRSSTLNNEISSESGSSSESCSSSKQTTEETKSSHLSSAITDIPTKDLKSVGSSCGSTNTSLSPSSTSLSGKKQKDSSESTNSTADASKTSPSSSSSKPVEFSASSNEKSQSNNSETPLRTPITPSTGGSSCSSAEAKPTAAAVAKADLRVSSESCAIKTRSDSRRETSVVSPPAQGQNLEFNKQIQNEERFKDETLKQAAESKEKKDNNAKSPVEEVNDSLAEQKGKQNCSPETPGAEKAPILCQVDLQVSDNVVDRKKEFNKIDVEAILDAEEKRTEERTVLVNGEKRPVKDEGSAVKPDCRPKATEAGEGETLPIKEEILDKHPETQSANGAETETAERTEEMICKDSVPDESVTQRSVRRTSRQDETNQDKLATDEPAITTRATRKTIKIPEEDSVDGSKDKNQRETNSLPSRDSQEHHKEESQETEEMPAKDIKPTTCEQKPSQEISDDVNFRETEEEEEEAATTRRTTGPTPERKSKRGMRSERTLERCAKKEKEEETCRDTVKGRRTRSSSAAVKTPVETNQSQEKEENPTESAEINSVAIEGKSAKTAPVVGEKLEVSKAETPDSRPGEGLQASDGVNEVKTCSQSETDAAAEEKETATDDRPASVQEENNLTRDEGLAVKPSQRTGASKRKNGENSPKNQESSAQKNETQTKDSSTETETEGAEEMVYRASVKDESGTKRSFRQTTRLAKQDKTKKDKAATVATTSTMTRKRKITEKGPLVERKEETPTRRRRAAAVDSPQNKEKTQKAAKETAPKDVTPLGCEQNPSPEISEDLSFRRTKEEEQEAATTRRKGRPKKTTGPAPGCRTRSSSAAVKTPVETNQSQEKKETPTESAEVKSVAKATQRRGQPKKTTRPAPVRKSTRVRGSNPDGLMLERLRNKRKMKFSGPEAKRSRSRFGRPDVRRPPFKP
ncbi:uncharacterized protein LOC105935949 isoform X2 [Fundulus heteroclitus]|uniref:uncharacterized protein LOC105935949 isoform X2 n=1 Tax=Fundulus heteroclitus TaxID=8078 RepID=UPI00165B0FF1|nr:uncharacterized protein LOC105935949 isoform X2 [Fundulus heteroclitus]